MKNRNYKRGFKYVFSPIYKTQCFYSYTYILAIPHYKVFRYILSLTFFYKVYNKDSIIVISVTIAGIIVSDFLILILYPAFPLHLNLSGHYPVSCGILSCNLLGIHVNDVIVLIINFSLNKHKNVAYT